MLSISGTPPKPILFQSTPLFGGDGLSMKPFRRKAYQTWRMQDALLGFPITIRYVPIGSAETLPTEGHERHPNAIALAERLR
jgi:hypothetical protein